MTYTLIQAIIVSFYREHFLFNDYSDRSLDSSQCAWAAHSTSTHLFSWQTFFPFSSPSLQCAFVRHSCSRQECLEHKNRSPKFSSQSLWTGFETVGYRDFATGVITKSDPIFLRMISWNGIRGKCQNVEAPILFYIYLAPSVNFLTQGQIE